MESNLTPSKDVAPIQVETAIPSSDLVYRLLATAAQAAVQALHEAPARLGSASPVALEVSRFVPFEVAAAAAAADPSNKVLANLDPRLQRLVVRRSYGLQQAPTSSTGVDEVAVIARVLDVVAWEMLSEVRVGATIGGKGEDGTTIVTGRIPVTRIEYVRQQPFVKSLKAAQPLHSALHRTLEETAARSDLLPVGHLGDGGRGVVVGIVDFGCDFAHENLRDADGSRVTVLWDQSGASGAHSPMPYGYGRLYTKADLDAALAHEDPYTVLGYGPALDTPTQQGTHGTHVADIAAGNGRGSGSPGVAPNADVIFVEVAASDVPWVGSAVVGKSFGDSAQLLEAVQFVFEQAGHRPCAVNISLGTNGGPHDGSTLVEQGLDGVVRQAPNRAVVVAASNSFSDGIHAAGTVSAGGTHDLLWNISVPAQSELEIWYAGADRFTLEILTPAGTSLGKVAPGSNKDLKVNGQVVLFASNRLNDPNNSDNMIGVFLEAGLPAGQWVIRLHGDTVSNGQFHAWIERNDAGQSSFDPTQRDNSHTIGSISCGQETVVVGSYDAHKDGQPLSFFSSAGPTRDGRQKPEISAPGHAVMAAHSRTKVGVTRKSGTSMASPAVTGIIALMLAETLKRNLAVPIAQLRKVLMDSARKNPPEAGVNWDPRFGRGRVFASGAIQAIMLLAPAPTVSLTAARASSKRAPGTGSGPRGRQRNAASARGGAKTRKRTGAGSAAGRVGKPKAT